MTSPGNRITPDRAGLFMPAEYAPHVRCWLAWPCRDAAFPGRLHEAKLAFAAAARAIAEFEPVTMISLPTDVSEAERLCGPTVSILPLEIDDSWVRDTGPTFIVDGHGAVAGIDWQFNGWGGVWPEHLKDAELAASMLDHLGMRRYKADLVLEGGAIHVDGQGTLMAVAPCLLDPKRNPGLTLSDLEEILAAYLGIHRFIWLEHGLENDETGGHVDNVACFAGPGRVLVHQVSDPADGNFLRAKENLAVLRHARDGRGRALELIPLEQPAFREGWRGRMTLTYLNFYLPNGGAVLPSFADPQDEAAFETLRKVFPDRRLVQVPALDIVFGGGGLHCITQPQPLGRPLLP